MATTRPLWMPLYIAEHLAETQGVSDVQELAYLRLQMAHWQSGAPLADNAEKLARSARLSPSAWRKAAPELSKFFTIADGVWRHTKLDEKLTKASELIAQKAAAGRASADRRRNVRSNGKATAVTTEGQRALQREGQRQGNQLQLQESESNSDRSDADPTRGENACQVRMQNVAGGAKRFAGIGPRPPGLKNQQKADGDLVNVLTKLCGMPVDAAWNLVGVARDRTTPITRTRRGSASIIRRSTASAGSPMNGQVQHDGLQHCSAAGDRALVRTSCAN